MDRPIEIIVDNRLRIPLASLPTEVVEALKAACTYENPKKARMEALGRRDKRLRYAASKIPAVLDTWGMEAFDDGQMAFTLPRGAMGKVRSILRQSGLVWAVTDRRVEGTMASPPPMVHRIPDGGSLRWYQEAAIAMAIVRQNCLIRSPTGSGKTSLALAMMARLGLPCLVIVWTSGLLGQWVARLKSELGLEDDQIGILGDGVKRVRPVTVAMQQTLYAAVRRGEVASYVNAFGVVICDECFVAGTLVLMADGTLRRIEEVRVGDRVAVGGLVTRIFGRSYEGKVFRIGDSISTPEHPFATTGGWRKAELICGDDVLWYDPLHAMRIVRGQASQSQQDRTMPEAWSGAVRCDDRSMSAMWEGSAHIAARLSCDVEMRSQPSPLEQGQNCGARRSDSIGSSQGERFEPAEHWGKGQGEVGRSSGSRQVCEGNFYGATCEVQERNGEKPFTGAGGADDSGWQNQGIWWQRTWERRDSNENGVLHACVVGTGRVCFGVCAQDGTSEANALQAGFCLPGGEAGDRARWQQSSTGATTIGGCSEGCIFEIPGLDDAEAATSAPVRLQQGRADVRRIACEVATRVFNLETDRHVYVAGGVLVHNCQRFAATTFTEVIDLFAAKYRVGVSDDETRADGLECIVYDTFGQVAFEVSQEELIEEGSVLDVECRIIPTEVRADWYVAQRRSTGSPDFNRLLDELVTNKERNRLIAEVVRGEALSGEKVIVLTHRKEHAQRFDSDCAAMGIRSGIMVGGVEWKGRYDEAKAGLLDGTVQVVSGTIQAVSTGIDIPVLSRGVLATPIGNNRQQYRQIRGRLCRLGKQDAVIYLIWDRHIQGLATVRRMVAWNSKVSIREPDGSWVDGRRYLNRFDGDGTEEADGAQATS